MNSDELLAALYLEESKRAAANSLYEFARQAWHVIEPGTQFVEGWHLETICDHLEAVTAGEIKQLLINIPPRHCKSILVSVLWPCWTWIHRPEHRWLCASYAGSLSVRDSIKCRRLIQSPWYQERWGDKFELTGDQNAKTFFENTRSGYRMATSVGAGTTGHGGDTILIDDPLNALDASSEAMIESTLEWWDQAMSTRLNDPKSGSRVIIMQRLHERDLSGHVLKQGGWEHLCLPAEWDGVNRKTSLGYYDPRTVMGALLWPSQYGEKEIDDLKIKLGQYGTSGQLQQRPSPSGGGIIDTTKFRLWPADRELPPMLYIVQAYDTAYTEKTTGDPTACTVWGVFEHKEKRRVILLDCWTDHLKYSDLRQKVIDDWHARYNTKSTYGKTGKADICLIENKGSGQALLNDLGNANVRACSYDLPRGQRSELSKVARVHLITPIIDAGLVYILESSKNEGEFVSWAQPFIKECQSFPVGEHDDMCDCLSMSLYYIDGMQWFDMPVAEEDDLEPVDYDKLRKGRTNPYAN